MVGKPGRSGGPRANSGGAREGAGRPPVAGDTTLSAARILTPGQKWEFAEYALQHAYRAIDTLVHIMDHGESETARIVAADKILDRSLGKAPQHIDVTALRHTDIVYQTAADLRKALMEEGVPRALLDLTVEPESDDAAGSEISHT
jgi:hypothetical protein